MTLARYLPRFQHARRRLAELASREPWSVEEMRAFQLQRINQLWSHAAVNVLYYRDLSASHRLPRRFESIEQYQAVMPLLEKDAIRERPHDFRWPGAARGRWRHTSGSTGTPMRFFESDATHQSVLACQYRFRQIWGLDLFDRAAFVGVGGSRPKRGFSVQRTRDGLSDWLRNRIRVPVHQMNSAALARELQRIEQFGPAYIYGYSRAIYLLALEAARGGWRGPSSRMVFMTSEPAFPHMVTAVERAFGAPAVVEYGSTECGVTAYEWRDRTLRVRSDRVLMETLPRSDGQYDIVKTILDNFDFPLFRYRIEDVTDAPLGATDQAFPILKNVVGRNDDVLYGADGTAVHPAEIDAIFECGKSPAVRRYSLHQNADGAIDVRIQPTDGVAVDVEDVVTQVRSLVPGREVRVQVVAEIPQTAAGKHRLITSDCKS